MKKFLFIFCSLFIIYFGLNIEVYAATNPDYYFDFEPSLNSNIKIDNANSPDSIKEILLSTFCTGINQCAIYCKSGFTEQMSWEVASYENFGSKCVSEGASYVSSIQKFYPCSWVDIGIGITDSCRFTDGNRFKGFRSINEIVSYMSNTTCRNNSCSEFVMMNYCGYSKGENGSITENDDLIFKNARSNSLCKSFKNVSDGDYNNKSDNPSCDMPVKDKDGNQKFTLSFSYDKEHDDFDLKHYTNPPDEICGATDEKCMYGNTTYHFYELGSSYSTFKTDLLNKWKDKDNDYKCSNFVQYCGYQDKTTKELDWYLSFEECPEGTLSQELGGINSTSEADEDINKIYERLKKFETHYGHGLIGDKTSILDCDTLLSGDGQSDGIIKILKLIVNIIKFIIPIILIVMGSLDFIQAIFAQEDGAMKKAQGKFIKRVIIAVIIFLIPSALKLILTIANGIWPAISSDFCGIL